jgi:hypothetical protein
MKSKISFSLMDDMLEYQGGRLCGNIVREKWVNDRLIELDSEAATLGCYFEYYFTLLMTGKGSLPKNGQVPERKMYKDGSKPLAKYELAEKNALRLKGYFEDMGLKIISAGKTLILGRFEGTIDLIVECTKSLHFSFDGEQWNYNPDAIAPSSPSITWDVGDHLVIDLKYSGLLDDKWDRYGWKGMLSAEEHIQKKYHGMQAIQYHYITKLPFYFMVVSSTNENDIDLFHVEISKEQIETYIALGNQLYKNFEFEASIGFEARPEISRCNACPLREECKDKHTYPNPKIVNL